MSWWRELGDQALDIILGQIEESSQFCSIYGQSRLPALHPADDNRKPET